MLKKLPFRFTNNTENILLYIPDIKVKPGHKQKYRKKKIYTRWLPRDVRDRFINAYFKKEISLSAMIMALEQNYNVFDSFNNISTAFAIADCFMVYHLNPRTNDRNMIHRAIYDIITSLRSYLIFQRGLPTLGINMTDVDISVMLENHGACWWQKKDLFGIYSRKYRKILAHLSYVIMTLEDFIKGLKNYRIDTGIGYYVWMSNRLHTHFSNFHTTKDHVYITEKLPMSHEQNQELVIYTNPYFGNPINLNSKAVVFKSPISKSWELNHYNFLMFHAYNNELSKAINSIFFEARILAMLKNYIDYLTDTVIGF